MKENDNKNKVFSPPPRVPTSYALFTKDHESIIKMLMMKKPTWSYQNICRHIWNNILNKDELAPIKNSYKYARKELVYDYNEKTEMYKRNNFYYKSFYDEILEQGMGINIINECEFDFYNEELDFVEEQEKIKEENEFKIQYEKFKEQIREYKRKLYGYDGVEESNENDKKEIPEILRILEKEEKEEKLKFINNFSPEELKAINFAMDKFIKLKSKKAKDNLNVIDFLDEDIDGNNLGIYDKWKKEKYHETNNEENKFNKKNLNRETNKGKSLFIPYGYSVELDLREIKLLHEQIENEINKDNNKIIEGLNNNIYNDYNTNNNIGNSDIYYNNNNDDLID